MTRLRPWHGLAAAAATSVAAAGVWMLWRFDPNLPGNPFPPCMFLLMTGHWCAGCGITRALHALVHGDLPGALRMNALAMLLLAAVPFALLWHAGWKPAALRPLARAATSPWCWGLLLGGFWIARNLPWMPFALLAPG